MKKPQMRPLAHFFAALLGSLGLLSQAGCTNLLSESEVFFLELKQLKHVALQNPEILRESGTGTPLELAVALRDHVHQISEIGVKQEIIPMLRPFENYVKTRERVYPHLCAGLAITYLHLLKAFGLEGRHVKLFDSVQPGFNGHNSVEVFLGGRWVVQDPTFNTAFGDPDRLFGFEELAKRWSENQIKMKEITHGKTRKSGLTLAEYPVSYESLLTYIFIYPGRMGENYSTLPPEWDGTLTIRPDLVHHMNDTEPWWSTYLKPFPSS